MPIKPKPACPVCRRVGCVDPAHRPKVDWRKQRERRPVRTDARNKAAVQAWVEVHGYVCPGYKCPPHESDDLTADHVVPLFLGGDPNGELRVLCRGCNSRRGAEMQAEKRRGR